ncbi:unnamed protein product [Leuciscus chuanchicus]
MGPEMLLLVRGPAAGRLAMGSVAFRERFGGKGEDTFELHSVQLELDSVEKQIRDLLERQAELRDRRSALETSRADAHKSVVSNLLTPTSSTPCVSLHRTRATRTRSSLVSFTPAPTHHHGPWVIPQRKTRARTRARTSPPLLAFEISTRNRFSPLRETGRDAVIIGTSIVRHVHATSGKGKVRTHCFPGARVLDVAAQVPEILNGDERIGAVVLHAGTNERHQAAADGGSEEGLQEPDRDGTQHIA